MQIDPFYPTNKDPLAVSYRDWMKMIYKNPQLANMCPGTNCCANGWQKEFARSYYTPMGTGCSCNNETDLYLLRTT